jgi:hypothetical protein
VSEPPKRLALSIFKDMWHSYKITNVLLLIPYFNVAQTHTSPSPDDQKTGTKTFDLYTWSLYSSEGNCFYVNRVNIIDKWSVHNANLFPNKIPGDFQGCGVKVATHIFPPLVVELNESNGTKYGGLELSVLSYVLEKLNLSVEYKVIHSTNKLNFDTKTKVIAETAFGETDISVGGLLLSDQYKLSADFTVDYAEYATKWYVPCAKIAHRWDAIFQVYSLSAWLSFCVIDTLVTFVMHLSATCVNDYRFRESHNYKTFPSCLYIVLAISFGVCVPAMPKTPILKIIFFAFLCYSFVLTTVFQSYFTSFLVDPGFEKQISSVKDILESGIGYGYTAEIDKLLKNTEESEYRIMQQHRVRCENESQCLERTLNNGDFACIANTYFVEYLRKTTDWERVKHNVCTLQNNTARMSNVMYLKKAHPILNKFNEILRRMVEAGLVDKCKYDLFTKDRIRAPSSANHQNYNHSNNVDDNKFKAGYFAFSFIHLQIAFDILLLGFMLSTLILIGEIVYQRFSKCGP